MSTNAIDRAIDTDAELDVRDSCGVFARADCVLMIVQHVDLEPVCFSQRVHERVHGAVAVS